MVFSDGAFWMRLCLGVIGWDGKTAPWLASICSFREEGRKPEVLILLCKVSRRLSYTGPWVRI